MSPSLGRRKNNKAWKHIYGVDRAYTRRVDALAERTRRPTSEDMAGMAVYEELARQERQAATIGTTR